MIPPTDLHPFIRDRYSPRAFEVDRPVEPATLRTLFEAARWAPSCFNEQPWRFIVAWRGDAGNYERLLDCLVEGNRAWAQTAPVLMLSCAVLNFGRNGKPNRWAMHDVGLAVGGLLVQATAMGLYAHQMGGFDEQKAKQVFGIPENVEPAAAIALGFKGDPSVLPQGKTEIDPASRERVDLADIVFHGDWGHGTDL